MSFPRHVLAPGGKETACGRPISQLPRGHTAGHELEPIRCAECRAALRRRPQLLAAIIAELRSSGLEVPELGRYTIHGPPLTEAQRRAIVRRKARARAPRPEGVET